MYSENRGVDSLEAAASSLWSCRGRVCSLRVRHMGRLIQFTLLSEPGSVYLFYFGGVWAAGHESSSLRRRMEIQGEMLRHMLFPLLRSGCNPSVSDEWKVCRVQKVERTSLLGPLPSRECETAGDNHMLSKCSSKLPSSVYQITLYHHIYTWQKQKKHHYAAQLIHRQTETTEKCQEMCCLWKWRHFFFLLPFIFWHDFVLGTLFKQEPVSNCADELMIFYI